MYSSVSVCWQACKGKKREQDQNKSKKVFLDFPFSLNPLLQLPRDFEAAKSHVSHVVLARLFAGFCWFLHLFHIFLVLHICCWHSVASGLLDFPRVSKCYIARY